MERNSVLMQKYYKWLKPILVIMMLTLMSAGRTVVADLVRGDQIGSGTIPDAGIVGQELTFSAIQDSTVREYRWSFGDGATAVGIVVTHKYGAPGQYVVTICLSDGANMSPCSEGFIRIFPAAPPGTAVNYPSGWNLIGLPPLTKVDGTYGPLYLWQSSAQGYQSVGSNEVVSGVGYWAYFTVPTSLSVAADGPIQPEFNVPGGEYTLIGNPTVNPVQVTGVDVMYVYDPMAGIYRSTNTLPAGQGAWVYSAVGGTAKLSREVGEAAEANVGDPR